MGLGDRAQQRIKVREAGKLYLRTYSLAVSW